MDTTPCKSIKVSLFPEPSLTREKGDRFMDNIDSLLPQGKYWFGLKETCALKGLNYKTACTRPWLQPNGGIGEKVGGRKVFRREVVANWLGKSDEQIIEEKS